MEAPQEVPSRDQSGTHLKGNSSGHLNIKKRKATFVEMLNEVKEGSFGGIRDSVKHGLTREISANGFAKRRIKCRAKFNEIMFAILCGFLDLTY